MTDNAINLLARALLAHIFVLAGIGKMGGGYAGTQGYMESQGVPGELLPVVILVEVLGGLMLLGGFLTRWTALVLAGFTLLAGVLFHFEPGDAMQRIQLMKNLAITGGLLMVWLHGAGGWSLDAQRRR